MPRLLITAGALAACLAAGAGRAVAAVDAPGFETTSHVYRCTGGARLPVVYLNIKGGDSFATAYINGRLVLMKSGPTGSGARYIAVDEQLGYRWHVKGDAGSLLYLAPDHAARETTLLQDCKAQQPS